MTSQPGGVAPARFRVATAQVFENPLVWRTASGEYEGRICGSGFDDERNVTLVFSCSGETFEVGADAGVRRLSTSDPEADSNFEMLVSPSSVSTAYESANSRLLVFSEVLGWAVNRAQNRPALRFAVPLISVRANVLTPFRLELLVAASGIGSTATRPRAAVRGYEIFLHLDGAFRSVGRLTTDGVLSDITLSRLTSGPRLVAEVRSLGVNGAAEANVQVDSFSVGSPVLHKGR